MLKFYGLHKNGLWYLTDTEPTSGQSYITIEADTRHEAECKLFEMVVETI